VSRLSRLPVFEIVDARAVAHFAATGCAWVRTFDAEGGAYLRAWVEEVASWPDRGGAWLQYREMTDEGPKLCRSENFPSTTACGTR
jgi:hypothetical protein